MPEAPPACVQERVSIAASRRLDGELAYPADGEVRGAILLLNPHPYMGGSMRNNVIERLHTALGAAGFAVLRFDYSGVGASEGQPIDVAASMAEFWLNGHAPVDPLMIDDGAAALRWLRARVGGPIALVGYSFGCLVAASILPADAAALALISPTIVHHEFAPGFAHGVPTLVITSDNDFATPADRFSNWVKRHEAAIAHHHCITGAQHFFLDREGRVCELVTSFVSGAIATAGGSAPW